MKLPTGFEVAGLSAGIKPSGKPDLGLIYSPHPLSWAMVATRNHVRAPCVSRNQARYITEQPVQALIVNAGNANAGTGDQGIWDNEDMAGAAANALALPRVHDALTASTGVIGERLPIDRIQEAAPELARMLGSEIREFSDAILTTDTRPKRVAASLRSGARIVGVAKGSGMIHPDMGTLLAFVITDAILPQRTIRDLWPLVVDRSFNQVSVDGDTSPNDMALLFSSNQRRADPHEFRDALDAVCQKLAEKVARDGEGASTLITVRVKGGRDSDQARAAARAIVSSNLVKAAVHGRDPNWGRVLSAVGASGALPDLSHLHISIQGEVVYLGQPQTFDRAALTERMNAQEVVIEVNLAAGEATATAWGCDLTAQYVSINALYTT